MPNLALASSGNSVDSIWALIDPTSYVFSSSNNGTAIANTALFSATFTPGAITIDGIALYLYSTSGNGTFTVGLAQGGVDVPGTVVTVNISDLNMNAALNQSGWFFFKFTVPVTLLAATAYTIKAITTAVSVTILYVTSTNNWCRFLRTTTRQNITVGDKIHVQGEYISPGVSNTFALNWNHTTNIVLSTIHLSRLAIFNWETIAGTYYLNTNDEIRFGKDAIFNLGSADSPYSANAEIIFTASATSTTANLKTYSTTSSINIYGGEKKAIAIGQTGIVIGATNITVDNATGWLVGDQIVITQTSRFSGTYESELRTITGISGNTVTVAATTYAHDLYTVIVNLTRNVKIHGASSTLRGAIFLYTTNTTIRNVEFYYMGNSSNGALSIVIGNGSLTSSINIQNNGFYDCVYPLYIGGTIYNILIEQNAIFRSYSYGIQYQGSTSSPTTVNFIWNVVIGVQANGHNYIFGSALKNINVLSNFSINAGIGYYGFYVSSVTIDSTFNFNGNIASSNYHGLYFGDMGAGGPVAINKHKSARNMSNDVLIATQTGGCSITFDSLITYGGNYGVEIGNFNGNITFNKWTALLDPTYAGIFTLCQTQNYYWNKVTLVDCDLQTTNTSINTYSPYYAYVECYNTTMSGKVYTYASTSYQPPQVFSFNHQRVVGAYTSWKGIYRMINDNTVYEGTPSVFNLSFNFLVVPAPPDFTTTFGSFKVAANAGELINCSIKARKSITADGENYTGQQPELILKQNYDAGIMNDAVLATGITANGNWETLIGAYTPTVACILEFAVRIKHHAVNSPAGWVNFTRFLATATADTSHFDYIVNGEPVALIAPGSNGTPVFSTANTPVIRRKRTN